jgi:hypothetical protein
MDMMLKHKFSVRNRSQKRHPDLKKHGKFGSMWKWCWLVFDCEGVIHHEFLPHGQTVNEKCYLKVMKRPGEAVIRKGGGKTGCSIMMTLWCIRPFWFVIFSQNMRWSSSSRLCTHQTMHQQTSFSSPCWNPYWKDDNLSLLRRLLKICWQNYAVFQRRYSRNASKSGRNAESDVEQSPIAPK